MSFYSEKVRDKNNNEYKSKKYRRLKAEHIQYNNYKELIVKNNQLKMKTCINLTILLLAVFISMVNCMEVKLGSGVGLESGTGVEARWWPGTNCQTQTEMSTECCL